MEVKIATYRAGKSSTRVRRVALDALFAPKPPRPSAVVADIEAGGSVSLWYKRGDDGDFAEVRAVTLDGTNVETFTIDAEAEARFLALVGAGMESRYYAVARHGTNGLDSYGFAEVIAASVAPRGDQTTTVYGPYQNRQAAQTEADAMNAVMNAFALTQDA